MTREDMLLFLAKESGLKMIHIEKLLDGIFEVISEAVENGEKVVLKDFGTFTSKSIPPTYRIHPDKGYIVDIPGGIVPAFTAGVGFEDEVNEERQKKRR